MKLLIAWNVWNNYLDTALGSEIVRLENEEKKIFEDLRLISQGGYPDPPTKDQAKYLDEHFFVGYPEVPLLQAHSKFKGVFRVIEGIQKAYQYAQAKGYDYALVTNADAWCLSLEKLARLLSKPEVRAAAIAMRVGWLTGVQINFGSAVPLFDDHFIILNIAECKKLAVFDYDHSARFFRPHFGHFGGIHYILHCLVNQRLPAGKFHIYSDLSDTINHYGDWMGWNLLPWQYQLGTSFLHANCAQVPSLNILRAAFLDDLNFTRYPLVAKYCQEFACSKKLFRRRHGVLVYKKPFKRAGKEFIYWNGFRFFLTWQRRKYKKFYRALPQDQVYKKTLTYFDTYKHIKTYRLTQ